MQFENIIDYFALITSLLTPSSALSTRVKKKKKSFADDRIKVIPTEEAEISGHVISI